MASAPVPFAGGDAFIQKNCASCHNATAPAAKLDLTKLSYEPASPDNFATWVKVHDRVSAGEMPPAGIPRPAAASITPFIDGLIPISSRPAANKKAAHQAAVFIPMPAISF